MTALQAAKKLAKVTAYSEAGTFWGGVSTLVSVLGTVGLGDNGDEEPDAEEVRLVIENNLGEVELLENSALTEKVRWKEDEQVEYFGLLIEYAAKDTLGLVPV